MTRNLEETGTPIYGECINFFVAILKDRLRERNIVVRGLENCGKQPEKIAPLGRNAMNIMHCKDPEHFAIAFGIFDVKC